MEIDTVALSKYLKRLIAEKNRVIGGMSHNFLTESRDLRNDIYRQFARGGNDLYLIDRDIAYRGKRDISIYNYFDLDTLIAYNKYLDLIIRTMDSNKRFCNRNYFTPKDMGLAIKVQVPKYCLEHAGEVSTGFYNPTHPITPLRDEDGKLTYEKTPDKRSFEKKYGLTKMQDMLDEYIDTKVLAMQEKQSKKEDIAQEKQSPDTIEYVKTKKANNSKKSMDEEMDILSLFTLNIHGKKYNISHVEKYFDSNFSPVNYIVGVSDSGRFKVIGFVDIEGNEYTGDAYSADGEIVVDRSQTGLDFYVDGNLKSRRTKTSKPSNTSPKPRIKTPQIDDDQLEIDN